MGVLSLHFLPFHHVLMTDNHLWGFAVGSCHLGKGHDPPGMLLQGSLLQPHVVLQRCAGKCGVATPFLGYGEGWVTAGLQEQLGLMGKNWL